MGSVWKLEIISTCLSDRPTWLFFHHPSPVDYSCLFLFSFLQEFSSYNSLGQGQFSQYYALPPSYVPAGLPSSDDHGAGVGVAGYSAVKSEQAASAGLPPRGNFSSLIHIIVCSAAFTALRLWICDHCTSLSHSRRNVLFVYSFLTFMY